MHVLHSFYFLHSVVLYLRLTYFLFTALPARFLFVAILRSFCFSFSPISLTLLLCAFFNYQHLQFFIYVVLFAGKFKASGLHFQIKHFICVYEYMRINTYRHVFIRLHVLLWMD